jgi:hypothetical protein
VNRIAGLALKRGRSVDFTGYWQRHCDGWTPSLGIPDQKRNQPR